MFTSIQIAPGIIPRRCLPASCENELSERTAVPSESNLNGAPCHPITYVTRFRMSFDHIIIGHYITTFSVRKSRATFLRIVRRDRILKMGFCTRFGRREAAHQDYESFIVNVVRVKCPTGDNCTRKKEG